MRPRNVTIGILGITLLLLTSAGAMLVFAEEDFTSPCDMCHTNTSTLSISSNATGIVDALLGEQFTLIVDATGYFRGDGGFCISIYKSWEDNAEFNFTEGFVGDGDAGDLNTQMRNIQVSITFTALSVGTHTIRIWTAGKVDLSKSLDVEVSVGVIDSDPPTIDSPSDMTIEEGEAACVTWTPNDSYPATYEVHANGTLCDSGDWDGSSIECTLNALAFGTHSIIITVYDINNNIITDEVIVIVTEAGGETDSPTAAPNEPLNMEAITFQWSIVVVSWVAGFVVFFIAYEVIRKR